MTGACEVATNYWFNILKFPVLRAPKATTNETSRRISEKQGMRVIAIEERDYVSGRFLSEIWEIAAAEWNAGRQLEWPIFRSALGFSCGCRTLRFSGCGFRV